MGRTPQDVTDAELAVLRVLWRDGSLAIRQIADELYPGKTDSDYATVKKLLARLEKKKCVKRDRSESAHRFEATLTLDDLVGKRLDSLAKNLCGGSQAPLLMHLLRDANITRQQQEQLRKLIQNLSKNSS